MEKKYAEYEGQEANELAKKMIKLGAKNDTWEFFLIDPIDNSKWVKDYPQGELQGGGSPRLRKVDRFPEEIEKSLLKKMNKLRFRVSKN